MRIEARGLTRRFGAVRALDGLDFAIPSGRRVALVGPNGSGKSTLNRVLMGLIGFEGDVRVGGASPRDDRLEVARRIAYVPQIAPALAAPVGELVRALAGLRGVTPEPVAAVAAELDLDLPAVWARPVRGLSGGMRQKLLLALALATPAALVILDEPTGSLDAASRERFFALCTDRIREATLLLCSHRLEEVRQLVDSVLLLEGGRLTYDGPVEAFVDAKAASVVEVRVEGGDAEAWLAAHGFRRGRDGWWVRATRPAEKRAVIGALSREFGDALRDLNARDLEALDVAGGSGDAGLGAGVGGAPVEEQ